MRRCRTCGLLGAAVYAGLLAKAALAVSAGAGDDETFRAAKLTSAKFFGEQILPSVQGLLPAVLASSDDLFRAERLATRLTRVPVCSGRVVDPEVDVRVPPVGRRREVAGKSSPWPATRRVPRLEPCPSKRWTTRSPGDNGVAQEFEACRVRATTEVQPRGIGRSPSICSGRPARSRGGGPDLSPRASSGTRSMHRTNAPVTICVGPATRWPGSRGSGRRRCVCPVRPRSQAISRTRRPRAPPGRATYTTCFVGRSVSTFWIDTDSARRAAADWAQRADAWFRIQFDLEGDLAALELGDAHPAAVRSLATASAELWVNVSFVRLTAGIRPSRRTFPVCPTPPRSIDFGGRPATRSSSHSAMPAPRRGPHSPSHLASVTTVRPMTLIYDPHTRPPGRAPARPQSDRSPRWPTPRTRSRSVRTSSRPCGWRTVATWSCCRASPICRRHTWASTIVTGPSATWTGSPTRRPSRPPWSTIDMAGWCGTA